MKLVFPKSILLSLILFSAHSDGSEKDYVSPFEDERKVIASQYSVSYSSERQAMQDAIISKQLNEIASVERPKIIFTAGPMGVGKSTTLSGLEQAGFFNQSEYLRIDADQFKLMIPEYQEYFKKNPATAATKVHQESMHMADFLLEKALKEKKNIILDSSMKNFEHYSKLMDRINKTHPEYFIEIVSVEGKADEIIHATKLREVLEGRAVPEEVVLESVEEVKKSVPRLSKIADRMITVENHRGSVPTVKKIAFGGYVQEVDVPLVQRSKDKLKSALKGFKMAWIQSPPKHIVFDIDWTLVSEVPVNVSLPRDWQTVMVQGKQYRVGDHLGSLMKSLKDNPDVLISFFSGGSYSRNYELLSKIKPPELKGLSLFDIAHHVMSFSDLSDAHPDKKVFAERYVKSMSKIARIGEEVVLVDDSLDFLKTESGGLKGIWTGKSFAYFPNYQDAVAASKIPGKKYIPQNYKEYIEERNRLARVQAILVESLKEAKETKGCLLDIAVKKSKENVSYWTQKGLSIASPYSLPCQESLAKLLQMI